MHAPSCACTAQLSGAGRTCRSRGELHAQTAELGLLSLYFPDIDRAAGHFNADLNVAGTLGAPRSAASLKLTDGEIDSTR